MKKIKVLRLLGQSLAEQKRKCTPGVFYIARLANTSPWCPEVVRRSNSRSSPSKDRCKEFVMASFFQLCKSNLSLACQKR